MLLTTVSAAALALAAPQVADAQQAPGPAWWASIEGQYTFIDGDAFGDSYYDSGVAISPDRGAALRLNFGGKVNNDWFVGGGIRYGRSKKESSSFGYSSFSGYTNGDIDYKESHLVLDLEIGRDVGIGDGGTLRVFGGLRFARFNGKGNANATYYSSFNSGYGDIEASSTHRFTGVGPRIGVSASVPVAGNLNLDLGVAGAALYGKRKLSINGTRYYYSEFDQQSGSSDYSYSDSDKGIVPNVEASVALSYLLSPNASVSAGYRVEKFWNIMPTFAGESVGKTDRLIHGPFLKFTVSGN